MTNKTNQMQKIITCGPPASYRQVSKRRGGGRHYTNADEGHTKALSYFSDDAAITMANECNRATKSDDWQAEVCLPCGAKNFKVTWHVVGGNGHLCR